MNFEKVIGYAIFALILIIHNMHMQKLKYSKLMVVQVRSIDPYVVTYMDEYAMLLKIKSDYPKLSKLVHDLLSIDPTRPEVFVALSVLWESKDERGALSYAEKVGLLTLECHFFIHFSRFPSPFLIY